MTSTSLRRPTVQLNEPPEVDDLTLAEWEQYEAAKHGWLVNNPGCTSRQFESAMQRILKEMGL